MDKSVDTIKTLEEKPIDELGDLDDQLDDLMFAAERCESQKQRFVLAVDATSSMYSVWNTAKTALKQAVDEIQSSTTVPIEIKVIAYRDHIYDSVPLEASNWSNDTDYLKDYISKIPCQGGGDYPESIGHAFAAIKGDQILPSQVILIGDAPSKEGSWGYAEAKYFGSQKCLIYALYTDKDPRLVDCFKEFARLSGGKASYLGDLKAMSDILKVILASNKVLAIEYQATSIEGKRLELEMKS